jgi:hypothetical protein
MTMIVPVRWPPGARARCASTLDASELDEVAGWVATEKSRTFGDWSVVVWLVTRCDQSTARVIQVIDIQTEMSSRSGITIAAKEMQLEAFPGREPHQLYVAQARRSWQLAKPEELAIESAQRGLIPAPEWRRNVL